MHLEAGTTRDTPFFPRGEERRNPWAAPSLRGSELWGGCQMELEEKGSSGPGFLEKIIFFDKKKHTRGSLPPCRGPLLCEDILARAGTARPHLGEDPWGTKSTHTLRAAECKSLGPDDSNQSLNLLICNCLVPIFFHLLQVIIDMMSYLIV